MATVCYRMMPRDRPEHHKPSDAFEQEEQESGDTEGLQPLKKAIHGHKGKGVNPQTWLRKTRDWAYNTASPEMRTCLGSTWQCTWPPRCESWCASSTVLPKRSAQ